MKWMFFESRSKHLNHNKRNLDSFILVACITLSIVILTSFIKYINDSAESRVDWNREVFILLIYSKNLILKECYRRIRMYIYIYILTAQYILFLRMTQAFHSNLSHRSSVPCTWIHLQYFLLLPHGAHALAVSCNCKVYTICV